MWKPAERIRYTAAGGTWPDAAAAAAARLFQPVDVGPVTLEQRTWVPAMVPWRATDEGFVSDDVINWYRRFAEGRPGAIVVEATGVRDIPSGPLLRIGDDRFVPGLERLVAAVREASEGHTRVFIQLIDFLSIRRRPDPEKYFQRFLVVTPRHRERLGMQSDDEHAVRDRLMVLSDDALAGVLDQRELDELHRGARERVTDMNVEHIRELPRRLPDIFAAAAVRAVQAGFDGVELHYAHAYTMASFLSALNTREDGYGGPRENRVRLPLEVHARVRAAVRPGFAVGCRFLSEDCIAGGNTIDDAGYFAVAFARAGMDFLSLSRGGKFEDAKQPRIGEAAYPYTGPSGYECMPQYLSDTSGPFGRNVGPSARIRAAVRAAGYATPIVVAGGIHAFEQAEAILAAEQADIIGFARQALADPDWFIKVRAGCGGQVRLCEYTNYCEGLDQKHKQVTCQLWDREALDEPGTTRSKDGRRRLIAPRWRRADP
ncbi:MAG: oxidoreductase [Gammaproteobacteria bacterium]|jgi:2,4-dienoyl-CoA reductase-like NADH-dependent reductase (Old Yellow Enzyme family)